MLKRKVKNRTIEITIAIILLTFLIYWKLSTKAETIKYRESSLSVRVCVAVQYEGITPKMEAIQNEYSTPKLKEFIAKNLDEFTVDEMSVAINKQYACDTDMNCYYRTDTTINPCLVPGIHLGSDCYLFMIL
jgi:hypothetical protein